jgi:hypothetical protein
MPCQHTIVNSRAHRVPFAWEAPLTYKGAINSSASPLDSALTAIPGLLSRLPQSVSARVDTLRSNQTKFLTFTDRRGRPTGESTAPVGAPFNPLHHSGSHDAVPIPVLDADIPDDVDDKIQGVTDSIPGVTDALTRSLIRMRLDHDCSVNPSELLLEDSPHISFDLPDLVEPAPESAIPVALHPHQGFAFLRLHSQSHRPDIQHGSDPGAFSPP